MNKTETDLLDKIQKADQDRKIFKDRIRKLQKDLAEAESNLIEINIRKERFLEELRVFKESDPTYVPDARDLEIEMFRQKFPELCKKPE